MLNNLFPKEKLLIPIFLFSTFFISDAFAQQIGGFFRNYNAVLTSDDNAYLIGRNRINLDLKFNTGFGDVFISNKIINDYTKQNHDYTLDFNEAYIDIFFTKSDVRIGKQIVNQGRTNGTFITDIISPVDISEFLTIDIRDIKSSIPAIKYNRYFGSNFLELVISPIFQSNILPNPESRWFPFVEIEKQISVSYADSSQDNSYKSFQGMIKWAHRENLKWDLDLFAMWWTLGTPSYKKDLIVTVGPFGPVASIKLAKSYLKSPIFGYSGDLILNENLILSSESAFHINKHFDYLPPLAQNSDLSNLSLAQQQALATQFAQNDDGYLFEKPWLVSMLGIQTNIYGIELTTQFLFEKIFNYDKKILQKELFYYSTLSLQKTMLRNNLTLSGFSRYNYVADDFWINPEASYNLKDGLIGRLGFHFFGGQDSEPFYGHFNFKSYAPNSFGYVSLTAFF